MNGTYRSVVRLRFGIPWEDVSHPGSVLCLRSGTALEDVSHPDSVVSQVRPGGRQPGRMCLRSGRMCLTLAPLCVSGAAPPGRQVSQSSMSGRQVSQSSMSGRQVSHSSSAGSLNSEPPTPVFRAFVTPSPRGQSAFTFPPREDQPDPEQVSPHPEPAPCHTEPEPEPPPRGQTVPKQAYHETEPKYPLRERTPSQPHPATEHQRQCQETEPKQLYQETVPKQPLRSEGSGRFLYPRPEPSGTGGKPRFPYPGSEPNTSGGGARVSQPGSVPSPSGGEPRYPYPGSEPQYAETEPKYVYQETEPKEAARRTGFRRYSEATSSQPRSSFRESGRSQSDETHRLSTSAAAAAGPGLLGDAFLDSDESGSLNVNSDMRSMQANVQGSNNVHVGTKVVDQRNLSVGRYESRVDNLHWHEHVETKQENIQNKHEHVQNKTEVHNRTENIKYERIEHKHEHIHMSSTGVVQNNQGGVIFADRLHLHHSCDCKSQDDSRSALQSVRIS